MAAIGAPVAERRAREIGTYGVYGVVAHAIVLRNCCLIVLHGILRADFIQAVFLELIICSFSFDISVSNCSEVRIQDILKSNRIIR